MQASMTVVFYFNFQFGCVCWGMGRLAGFPRGLMLSVHL